jgi:hypothetical protein
VRNDKIALFMRFSADYQGHYFAPYHSRDLQLTARDLKPTGNSEVNLAGV